ncbi:IS3 family transposase [Halodesulfovibrio marinisediminis]|uniref:IS3 family transposase n=1 Tax=Halodesulfovibrio marinisediminis TaxID=458711 RepID=UPI000A03D513
MRKIDELFLGCPFYGRRKMCNTLCDLRYADGRGRVRRLMRKKGLIVVFQSLKQALPLF